MLMAVPVKRFIKRNLEVPLLVELKVDAVALKVVNPANPQKRNPQKRNIKLIFTM
jgi:hypothetical protein